MAYEAAKLIARVQLDGCA